MTGEELRTLRLHKGFSRPALAKLAGLHPDTVKYWEAKPLIDLRGHAPDLLLKALGAGHMSRKNIFPAWSDRGNFWAPTRARNGVLHETHSNPPDTRLIRCGAKTRKGTPCKAKALPGKTRCKFHGGESTGPKTQEGRARIANAQRKRWLAYRSAGGGEQISRLLDHEPGHNKVRQR